jgi:hypothetical protein
MAGYDELGGDAAGAQIGQALWADYAEAQQPPDAGMSIWLWRCAFDALTIGIAASIAKHRREWRVVLGLAPDFNRPSPEVTAVMPPLSTRDEVLSATIGFQGITAHTAEYGTFPMFGPETTTLRDADLDAYCADILAAGFHGGEIAVSWAYAEPGFLMPVPGRDLSTDLPELTRRIARMRRNGLTSVGVFLAGDGRSQPKNPDGTYPYNDPVGHTYGYEWLMDNLERILLACRDSADGDLTTFIIFSPTYDGGFMDGWGDAPGQPDHQPQRVIDFGLKFRSILPVGYLAMEHTPGNIPIGNGEADWLTGGPLDAYDLLLSEYRDPITPGPPGDQVWQVVARTVPHYTRPANQPAGDDPRPPNYLQHPTSRGTRYKWEYEFATYPWTRGRRTLEQIEQDRAYFRAMGSPYVC